MTEKYSQTIKRCKSYIEIYNNCIKNNSIKNNSVLIDYKINNLGVSVYEPEEVSKLNKCSLDLAYQFPFNILDQRFLKVKMPINNRYARSIFLQGLLASKNSLHVDSPSMLKRVHKKYHESLENCNIDPIQAAISFVMGNKYVDYFLVGVDNLKQLKKIFLTRPIDISDFISQLPLKKNSYLYDPRRW